MDKSAKYFDCKRKSFAPYGITCERWVTRQMERFDQHNEIELNFFPTGNCSYIFYDRVVNVPTARLTLFWGLMPHRITDFKEVSPYYVCTIPLSQFLEWNLQTEFVGKVLSGKMLYDPTPKREIMDELLLGQWCDDLNNGCDTEILLTEIKARMMRFANSSVNISGFQSHDERFYGAETRIVSQIALFIARNYMHPIKVVDISRHIGLHPDYANAVFKKAFGVSLHEHVLHERINHAQRMLITTDKSITDIAWDCGFNTISCFNVAFSKQNGCTPREYRSRIRIKDS